MARSQYIYVLFDPLTKTPIAHFTVKHEALRLLTDMRASSARANRIVMHRYRDGEPGDVVMVEAGIP